MMLDITNAALTFDPPPPEITLYVWMSSVSSQGSFIHLAKLGSLQVHPNLRLLMRHRKGVNLKSFQRFHLLFHITYITSTS